MCGVKGKLRTGRKIRILKLVFVQRTNTKCMNGLKRANYEKLYI